MEPVSGMAATPVAGSLRSAAEPGPAETTGALMLNSVLIAQPKLCIRTHAERLLCGTTPSRFGVEQTSNKIDVHATERHGVLLL